MNDQQRNREFMRLFSQYSRAIYSHILTLVMNEADADELYQETSIVLWEKFEEFEPGTNFLAWASHIAYYKTLNFRRQKSQRAFPLDDGTLDLLAETSAEMAVAATMDADTTQTQSTDNTRPIGHYLLTLLCYCCSTQLALCCCFYWFCCSCYLHRTSRRKTSS